MTSTSAASASQRLTLTDELILMLLNEENGYFHQVPGWHLHCAVAGAVLAELSLRSRIDTDPEALYLMDTTETGDPALDPILGELAEAPTQRTARYWIERLAPHAEAVIDLTLDRLVERKILQHHDGDFWTLPRTGWQADAHGQSEEGTATQFIRDRIADVIFNDEIPDPRDIIVLCIVNACDVLRFIFQIDEETEERIELVCRMDLIGRSIAEAVAQNIAEPVRQHSALTKKIPIVPLRKLLFNEHARDGNIPALFADLAREFGPVYEIRPPIGEHMICLAGAEVNQWVNKRGRMHLRTKDYFNDFEKVYGASGVMPSLDGADHFRLRKAMSPGYSRGRLAGQLDRLYAYLRTYLADWKVGDVIPARSCRLLINTQLSPLTIGVDSQDLIKDLVAYKERALAVHIMRALPKMMMNTPGMKRKARTVDRLLRRIQTSHTPAQRIDQPRDLADDWLGLHASDPQFVPETTLRFQLSAALVASVYVGDAISFALYAMTTRPDLRERIRAEADALFENGDPDGQAINPSTIDVTHRFLMETLRMYPVVPMAIRNVMNACVVKGYEIPVGSRLFIASTAPHYMEEVFPDPHSFDIDRYLPDRAEHRSPGYAPYGLGTHRCLGFRQTELQLAINVLMIARHFRFEVVPKDYRLQFNPIPNMKPRAKLKFRIAEQLREVPA